jgi:ribulose-phosphate 3-epimerase
VNTCRPRLSGGPDIDMVQIVPSILSADFSRLGDEIAKVAQGGAKMLHIDIMDGHFVPNLTVGPPVVKALRKITKLSFDVHLMITDPDRYIPAFADAGANLISVHQETCPHLDRTLRLIKEQGAQAGVVLNPATPVTMLDEVLSVSDFVLIMSVNPGFGGQQFIPGALNKIRTLDRRRKELGLKLPIELDGGVNRENIAEIVRAGCDWVVAGATVFHSPDPAATVAELGGLARAATAIRI